jgi:hypothetical protein
MNWKTFTLLLVCSNRLFAQNFWGNPSVVEEGKLGRSSAETVPNARQPV